MGYLTADDVIVFNPYELLHVAKVEARAMFDAGYRPPLQAPVPVIGRYGMATIMAQLVNMRDGGFISAHDYKLGDDDRRDRVRRRHRARAAWSTSSGCSTSSARPSWSC